MRLVLGQQLCWIAQPELDVTQVVCELQTSCPPFASSWSQVFQPCTSFLLFSVFFDLFFLFIFFILIFIFFILFYFFIIFIFLLFFIFFIFLCYYYLFIQQCNHVSSNISLLHLADFQLLTSNFLQQYLFFFFFSFFSFPLYSYIQFPEFRFFAPYNLFSSYHFPFFQFSFLVYNSFYISFLVLFCLNCLCYFIFLFGGHTLRVIFKWQKSFL